MKRFRKILHNCPYLIAVSTTWLFLTIGGIVLMAYRDYGGLDLKNFWVNPFFEVIIREELYADMGKPVIAVSAETEAPKQSQTADKRDMEKILSVFFEMKEKDERPDRPATDIFDGMIKGFDSGIRGENDKSKLTGISILEIHAQDNDPEEEQLLTAEQTEEMPSEESAGEENEETVEPEEEKPVIVGRTLFTTYTPVETNSIYYYDVGKIAMTTEYPYTKVEEDYFEDAAFFGDSRTLGIADYAELSADFYCENGMTIYKLLNEKGVMCQNSGEKADINQVLQQKQYGKIYIMLGMNELGYGNTEYFQEQYQTVLEQIRQWQPQAVIYLMANLHVSQKKNNNATEFNNININAKNAAIADLADGIDIFYLDSNPLFIDNDGFLRADLTFDGVHLYADNYPVWREFLMEHGVVRENEDG